MRVVICDDNELDRHSLTMLLRSVPVDVVGVGDSVQLVEAAATQPDVVLLAAEVIGGMPAVERLREAHDRLGCVLMVSNVDEPTVLNYFGPSAHGKGLLVRRNVRTLRELLGIMEHVAAGGTVVDPLIVPVLMRQRRPLDDPLSTLSRRELEVLALMAQGYSNRGIAQALVLQPRTVEHHITCIMSKLGLEAAAHVQPRVIAVLTYLRGTGQLIAARDNALDGGQHV